VKKKRQKNNGISARDGTLKKSTKKSIWAPPGLHLGSIWEGFGTVWGVSGALWGASWPIFGRSKSIFFQAWVQDGPEKVFFRLLKRFWRDFGGFGKDLGGSWEDFGQFLDGFWKDLGQNLGES